MGNTGQKKPAAQEERRPGQVIALLSVTGLSALLPLLRWAFYQFSGVVYDSSSGVPPAAFSLYRNILLGYALLLSLLWLLLFMGKKPGYWLWAVFLGLDALVKLVSLRLMALLLSALYLYLLFCQETRIYFRIGQFKTLPPRKKASKGKP